MISSRCRACGKPLRDERSLHVGMGKVCALRTGHAWRGPERERAQRASKPRVRRTTARRRAQQLEMFGAAPEPSYAADERRDPACEGCQDFGVCAWHATSAATRKQWMRGRESACGNSNAPASETAEASCPQP